MKEGKHHLLVQHLHIRIVRRLFWSRRTRWACSCWGKISTYLCATGRKRTSFVERGGEVSASAGGEREGSASVEAGEEVLASAEEEGAFPVECGAAGLSSCVMKLSVSSPEKIFVFLECLSGAGRIFPARPVFLLVMMPLLLGEFIAISVKGKEPRSCRLEEFRPDVLEGVSVCPLVETVFVPPVRLLAFSFLHPALTFSLSNQLAYLHSKGVFGRALRFPGLKSFRSLGGLALFLPLSLVLFSSHPGSWVSC